MRLRTRPDVGLVRPEYRAAQAFMAHKGYDVEPFAVEPIEGRDCWYFYYRLPKGTLELEVERDETGQWHWDVTAFSESAISDS